MASLDKHMGTGPARRRANDLALAAAGLLVLTLCAVVARDGEVTAWESDIFRAINDLPQWLYRPLWPFQQLGALIVGPIVAGVALLVRRPRLAIATIAATILKLAGERVVKAFVERQRPGTSIGDVMMRGDVQAKGLGFVSGHAVLAVALATLISPYLRGRWKAVPWVLAAVNGFARIYVGAHNPLDVLGGSALGLALGSLCRFAFAVGPSTPDPQTEKFNTGNP